MFNLQETMAAKAIEEQQLQDHNSDYGDQSPLLGRTAQGLSSFEVSNRYLCLVLQQLPVTSNSMQELFTLKHGTMNSVCYIATKP